MFLVMLLRVVCCLCRMGLGRMGRVVLGISGSCVMRLVVVVLIWLVRLRRRMCWVLGMLGIRCGWL